MSILGSNIAASIAATAVQAPQAAQKKQQQEGNPQGEIRRVREVFESHLKALEESDRANSSTHLQIDGQLPEHQSGSSPQEEHAGSQDSPREESKDTGSSAPGSIGPEENPGQLYRHVDVQA